MTYKNFSELLNYAAIKLSVKWKQKEEEIINVVLGFRLFFSPFHEADAENINIPLCLICK